MIKNLINHSLFSLRFLASDRPVCEKVTSNSFQFAPRVVIAVLECFGVIFEWNVSFTQPTTTPNKKSWHKMLDHIQSCSKNINFLLKIDTKSVQYYCKILQNCRNYFLSKTGINLETTWE